MSLPSSTQQAREVWPVTTSLNFSADDLFSTKVKTSFLSGLSDSLPSTLALMLKKYPCWLRWESLSTSSKVKHSLRKIKHATNPEEVLGIHSHYVRLQFQSLTSQSTPLCGKRKLSKLHLLFGLQSNACCQKIPINFKKLWTRPS